MYTCFTSSDLQQLAMKKFKKQKPSSSCALQNPTNPLSQSSHTHGVTTLMGARRASTQLTEAWEKAAEQQWKQQEAKYGMGGTEGETGDGWMFPKQHLGGAETPKSKQSMCWELRTVSGIWGPWLGFWPWQQTSCSRPNPSRVRKQALLRLFNAVTFYTK